MSHHGQGTAPVPEERRNPAPAGVSSSPEAGEERLLIQALRERDEAAFEQVLDRHYPAMVRTAMTFVGSRARAEEVVQETWLAVLSGIDRFEGRSSLKTWIFRILVNRARSAATRDARSVPVTSLAGSREGGGWGGTPYPPDPLERIAAPGETAEERLLSAELGERIEAAIAALPPKQRRVIVLRDVEGWSANEVCDMLDVSEANQRVLLHRARVRVRDLLAPYLAQT
jgi:RNA polymerase sigma-70 factor (ECF subfamily)